MFQFKMNRLLAFLFVIMIFGFWVSVSYGMKYKSVIATGESSIANITPEQARKLALKRARQEAIEKTCGVQLQAETFISNYSLQGDFIHSVSYGKIIFEDILRWEIDVLQPSVKHIPELIYRVTIRAKVRKERGKTDPYYQVRVRLNKNTYQSGDEMTIRVKVTRPSYITVLNFTSDDRATLLFPNRIRRNNKIQSGKEYQIPSKKDQRDVLKLQVFNLPGHKRDKELIKVFATREPIHFLENLKIEGEYGVADTSKFAVTEIARLISLIPLKDRAEATVAYEIVSN